MPAMSLFKLSQRVSQTKTINTLEDHPLVSRHRHRSSSAINGFEDDNSKSVQIQYTQNDVFQADGEGYSSSKSSECDEPSIGSYVNGLDKSCNQCGMVWPKKRNTQVPRKFEQRDETEANKEKLHNGKANSHHENGTKDKELNGFHESAPNGVKSRVSFYEKKQEGLTVNPIRHAKSLSNLLEEPPISRQPIPLKTVEVEHVPIQLPKASGCPFSGKKELRNVRLKNYVQGSQQNDTLHLKSKETHCTGARCMGSLMQPYGGGENRPYGVARPREEVKEQAVEFLNEYYASLKKQDDSAKQARLNAVFKEIDERGTYDLEYDELVFGAKLAWRNAPRCIGRIQWNNLKVYDRRSLTTAQEMFDSICEHLEYATNGGNLRSTITVYRERREGVKDLRLWNSQLIKYAGYEKNDGSIVGDPASVEFTKLCMKLGWKGPGGRFDVLPLIIESNGEPPIVFDIPKHLALEVKIRHPDFAWFEELDMQWYALPAVANMKLDVGGVEFPFAPFNGWYMVTEVGARDLGDSARYNMLEPIAKRMNLDTRSPAGLWKDRAVTELNQAVMYSFQEAKVTIVDHHTASEQFMKHMGNEFKLRGGCPADWVWIVPPSSGSTTEVFHQEMLNYVLKPSYDYQEDAWRYYQFEGEDFEKLTFKQAAILVKTAKVLMNGIMAGREKATVLYATETGKSESFAKKLANMLSHAFDVNTYCMSDYQFSKLHQESLLMIVTSTFGNGEAPINGEEFGDMLYKLGQRKSNSLQVQDESFNLHDLRFAVFGLGSSAYPNFCAFAHSCRNILFDLGAKEIHPIGEGDELCGQDESFKKWSKTAFQAACDAFSIDRSKLHTKLDETTDSEKEVFDPKSYKYEHDESKPQLEIVSGLSSLHSKEVHSAKVLSVEELQSKSSSRSTILVKLDKGANPSLNFEPGDHLAIFPSNDEKMVTKLISQLKDAPHPDSQIRIKKLAKTGTENWEALQRLPQHFTLRQALTNFIDITTPPSQGLLETLTTLATDEDDKSKLENLSKDSKAYEEWKFENYPTITEILEDFPSLRLNGIELLTQWPILQSRYYSISSSPLMHPGEIHATVAVVTYETEGEKKRIHNGVCSYWLSTLQAGNSVPCYIRQATSFRMPKDKEVPVIMIGPGTGIAPLRSFWQQRKIERDMPVNENVDWGCMDLYAGCRRFKEDNIFMEEKQEALNDGTLDHAYLALSREPNVKKMYVQNILAKHAKDACDKLVKQKGHIYVCGDVAMAADVNKILCEIFQNQLGFSKEKARDFLKGMKSSGHYHEDIFGATRVRSRTTIEQK